jgi:NAD(P)-dependent dehydrogenase (short-subunit alcohol dehydrogenase family)
MAGDKIVLVTGSTDGVGKLVATRFAAEGARVLLHGRDAAKGAAVLEEIRGKTGSDKLEFFCADLSSLDEVRKLAAEVKARHDRIDLLINNAGIGASHGATLASSGPVDRKEAEHAPAHALAKSRDGHELRLAVNHLAAFLLTNLLRPELSRSASPRVVAVSSIGQSPIDFDDMMLTKGQDEMHAYRQSKFAQVMFTFELAERFKDIGITAVAVHPASFMATKMVLDAGITPKTTPEEGAEAIYRAATSLELTHKPELFFNSLQPMRAKDEQAYDAAARGRFWKLSAELTGIAG